MHTKMYLKGPPILRLAHDDGPRPGSGLRLSATDDSRLLEESTRGLFRWRWNRRWGRGYGNR